MKDAAHWFKLILLFLLLGTVIWPETAVSTAAAQAAASQSAIDPRFGAVESFWAPSEAAQLGVGWERILFYWNEIQPGGPDDWNTLHVPEEWLNEANAQGRQVVGLLKNTPNWATDGEFAAGVPNGLYLPVDDPANLWANYVRRVATYYGARGVHNWVVWNEPDIAPGVYGHEFSGSMEDYFQLLKVAYTVIKQADPAAKVHLGGLTYWHDPSWLGRFLQLVAADPEAEANNYYFDVISLHIYFKPETIPTIVGNAFAAQQQAGIPLKAVWINETNARPSSDPEWPVAVQAFNVDLEQQAWYIVQAYALGFYSGIGRIAVYKLIDINIAPGEESWGLIRPYDFSKRPAFFAYQNTIKYLSGFTYPVQREQATNYYVISFSRPQGVTRVLWARNPADVSLNVPALAETAVLVDPISGEESAITAVNGSYAITLSGARCTGECLMGGAPIFLVEDGVTADAVPTALPSTAVPTNESTPSATSNGNTATPEVEVTVNVEPTAVPTATQSPTAAPTETPSPTATATLLPTETATLTLTAVPPTETAVTTKTAVVPTAVEKGIDDEETAVSPPTNSKLFGWLLGGIGGIALVLILVWRRR